MIEAPALRCAYCGGALAAGAPVCPYCRSVVESVRCASCFHANLSDAVRCAGCGRELGLEPIPGPDSLACPNCQIRFVALDASTGGAVHDCPKCGGQFVDHDTLRAIFVAHPRAATSAGVKKLEPSLAPAAVHYRPCPICRNLMNRKNFGESSGIIVDVCKPHGVWFEAGELPRVLAFVESGGLEDAARRHEEARKEELRKRVEIQAESARSFALPYDDDEVALRTTGSLAVDVVIGLLRAGMRHVR